MIKILDFSGGTLIKVAYIGEDETEEVSVKCCNKLPLIEGVHDKVNENKHVQFLHRENATLINFT